MKDVVCLYKLQAVTRHQQPAEQHKCNPTVSPCCRILQPQLAAAAALQTAPTLCLLLGCSRNVTRVLTTPELRFQQPETTVQCEEFGACRLRRTVECLPWPKAHPKRHINFRRVVQMVCRLVQGLHSLVAVTQQPCVHTCPCITTAKSVLASGTTLCMPPVQGPTARGMLVKQKHHSCTARCWSSITPMHCRICAGPAPPMHGSCSKHTSSAAPPALRAVHQSCRPPSGRPCRRGRWAWL